VRPALAPARERLLLDPGHPLCAGRTGRGVTIAVIDSGVHPAHPHIRRESIRRLLCIAADGREYDDAVDRLGHGTAVAAAIQEKAPDAELHIVRVFEERLSTTATALAKAIDRAIEFEARLINLSLGTVRPEHAALLEGAVQRARAAGVIVVAARESAGAACFPGCLPDVAGAVLDASLPRDAVRIESGAFHASGQPRPIDGVPPERNLGGVSFAVANVTGMLALVLEGRPAVRGVDSLLAAL
jgi:subtilisin family serine protease